MSFPRRQLFARGTALIALCLFAGYLVADHSFHAADRHCTEMNSDCGQDQGDCHHCACAIHGGTVIACDPVSLAQPAVLQERQIANRDESAPRGEPLSIDHPPQLG